MSVSTRVKICGLSTPETLRATLDAGADMVGFVFFPRSPRHLEPGAAAALADAARGRAAIVALVVDPTDDALDTLGTTLRPDWLQLHGREPPDRIDAIARRTGLPIMKAVGVSTRADIDAAVATYGSVADRLLFDAKPPAGAALPGGNGHPFHWTILSDLDLPIPFMLSGGLTAANVAEAIRITGAPWVDVSSGVETAPGVKDVGAIAAFVEAARGGR